MYKRTIRKIAQKFVIKDGVMYFLKKKRETRQVLLLSHSYNNYVRKNMANSTLDC